MLREYTSAIFQDDAWWHLLFILVILSRPASLSLALCCSSWILNHCKSDSNHCKNDSTHWSKKNYWIICRESIPKSTIGPHVACNRSFDLSLDYEEREKQKRDCLFLHLQSRQESRSCDFSAIWWFRRYGGPRQLHHPKEESSENLPAVVCNLYIK